MLANLKVSGESEGLLQIDRELLHKYKPKLLLHPPKKWKLYPTKKEKNEIQSKGMIFFFLNVVYNS